MLKFLLRSVLSGLILAIVVTAVTFSLIFTSGEKVARTLLGQQASQGQIDQKIAELGLDRPVPVQYLDWLLHALTGDLGRSYLSGEPVTAMLATRVPVTLSIVVFAVLLTAILSVLVGVTAAVRGGWTDRALQVLGVFGAAIPNFIVAVGLVFLLAIQFPVFPATGYVPPGDDVVAWASSLALPVMAILVGSVANAAQQFRGAMIDALNQDHIRTLRARGISERSLVFRFALRNAAGPGLTILSLQTIGLFGGVVVIERIFGLPGIGMLASDAALRSNVPAVLGTVLFTVIVVVLVNITVAVLAGWLNPKVRTP